MDGSIFIKPRAGAQTSYAPRDPVPVREITETDLHAAKAVAAPGDGGGQPGDQHKQQGEHRERPAPEVMVDPENRDLIFRERDVRSIDREHPDQALLRRRAYRQPATCEAAAPAAEPHADIEA